MLLARQKPELEWTDVRGDGRPRAGGFGWLRLLRLLSHLVIPAAPSSGCCVGEEVTDVAAVGCNSFGGEHNMMACSCSDT